MLLFLFQQLEVEVNQNTASALHRSRRARSVRSSSLVLFRAQASEAVSHMKAQLIRALNYLLALLGTDVMSNLHRVLLVVHQQHLQVTRALHQEFVEAVPEAKSKNKYSNHLGFVWPPQGQMPLVIMF